MPLSDIKHLYIFKFNFKKVNNVDYIITVDPPIPGVQYEVLVLNFGGAYTLLFLTTRTRCLVIFFNV